MVNLLNKREVLTAVLFQNIILCLVKEVDNHLITPTILLLYDTWKWTACTITLSQYLVFYYKTYIYCPVPNAVDKILHPLYHWQRGQRTPLHYAGYVPQSLSGPGSLTFSSATHGHTSLSLEWQPWICESMLQHFLICAPTVCIINSMCFCKQRWFPLAYDACE